MEAKSAHTIYKEMLMATITYRVKCSSQDFEFTLRVIESGSTKQWEIGSARGMKGKELFLSPPGRWEYRMDQGRRGFLFFFLDGPRSQDPFVIALDEVPNDYLRGPFCAVAAGKGTFSPPANEDDIPIMWSVEGPGCV
jgi:hypothetical protein